MKIYRVRDERHQIRLVTSDNGKDFFALSGDIYYPTFIITNERVNPCQLLSPVEPTTIYGIGHNYLKHIEEQGAKRPEKPLVFMKSPSTLQDPEGPIYLPRTLRSDKVDYEGELAVVIGVRCKNVRREDALNYVLGYTIANDVSARDWQFEWGGGQFCRGKTFDTFLPLGPCVVTPDAIKNPNALRLQTRVNGQTVQDSNTSDQLFDVPAIIEFLSGSTTLLPGTVILTGTPSGVGVAKNPPSFLQNGDVVEIEIEGIGTLRNTVEEEFA
jgi:2-keto-4-pentenoate hydratase/2-oxohepta-3-ene-1,7-dioic acid hydratase in catechol pathway